MIRDSIKIPKIEFIAYIFHVLLTVHHNTSVTSVERVRCSKRITGASELGNCQSNMCHS